MRGFDLDMVEDLKGYVVKLPRHSRYAAVLKNSVALIETPEWRISSGRTRPRSRRRRGWGRRW